MPKTSVSPELRNLFFAIDKEVKWLHMIWAYYIQLYQTKNEHYEIMKSIAPAFFKVIQNILFNEFVLTLNRLTDKPKTSGRDNASLEQLIELIDDNQNSELVSSLRSNLKNIRDNQTAFQDWRNKKIAHYDRKIALGEIVTPHIHRMPKIIRMQADDAIKDITDFIIEFSEKVMGATFAFKHSSSVRHDGIALMQALKKAGSETKDG